MGLTEAVLRGKFIVKQVYLRKPGKYQVNNLNLHILLERVGTLRPPSDFYVRRFFCPLLHKTPAKTATQKLLSDQVWSLVPKLNLLQRSQFRHHSP